MRPFLPPLLALPLLAQSPVVYRQWINGQELGRFEELLVEKDGVQTFSTRGRLELRRLGAAAAQELETKTTRNVDGTLTFVWRIKLAQDPLEGEARFDPKAPGVLHLRPKGGAAREVPVPPGALLWEPEFQTRLKAAAAKGEGFTATRFYAPTQEWGTVELRCQGGDPLPGHPKVLRFTGSEGGGRTNPAVEFWVDPVAGILKEKILLGSLEVIAQAAELPAPAGTREGGDLFSSALKPIPPHALLPWLPELELLQTGGAPLHLREDAQCIALGQGRWRLRRASPPSAEEAAILPVRNAPSSEDAPFLAPSPLVQFEDPVFNGLLRRLSPKPSATRWDLAREVARFVFEWITDKGYSVGFASALEVARRPIGDCTEHGLLAIALLRKLGVPARGVMGWAAQGRTLSPHFWVEVKLKDRWIPVDPTFNEAPASAFHLKLSETDLAHLSSTGWDAAQALGGSVLQPRWPEPIVEGDRLRTPDGMTLRWPQGGWRWREGILTLQTALGPLDLQAVPRPAPALLQDGRLLQAPGGLRGWWTPSRMLIAELPGARWLQVNGLTEGAAFEFLRVLKVEER